VAVAGFNEQELVKERNINSSYGFAKSVGARQQKRPSRSIRLAAIVVYRKSSWNGGHNLFGKTLRKSCQYKKTTMLTDRGAAALAGVKQMSNLLHRNLMPQCRSGIH